MALQLTGAAKKDSLANLTVRLPVVVIGGGLTAVDSATESMAYYPIQVEKFLSRVEKVGKEKYFAKLSEEEKITAEEFISHARELRTIAAGKTRCKTLKQLGRRNTLAYRKNLARRTKLPASIMKRSRVGISRRHKFFGRCNTA